MWNGFCGDLIRKLNRNLLFAIVVIFASLIGFFAFNQRYFTSLFQGARAFSGAQLAGMNAASASDKFVIVQAGAVLPTGIDHITTDKAHPDGYIDSKYYLAAVDGQPLIVRSAEDFASPDNGVQTGATQTNFEGRLVPIADELRASLINRPDIQTALPFYLDTEDYKTFGYISLFIGSPILLFGSWLLWLYMQSSGDYARHSFARRLTKYGQIEMLVQQVDSEMAGAHSTFSSAGSQAELTTHWLIAKTSLMAVPMRLDSMVWVYRKLLKQKAYFVVTVNKRHSLVAYDRFGQKLAVQLKDAQVGDLLRDITAAAPQAMLGYDKQIEKLWRKTKDKSTFLAAAQALSTGDARGDQKSTQW